MVEGVDLAWFLTENMPSVPLHGHPRQQHTRVHFVDLGLGFAVWSFCTYTRVELCTCQENCFEAELRLLSLSLEASEIELFASQKAMKPLLSQLHSVGSTWM